MMHCVSMVLMCSEFSTHHDFTVFLFVDVLITEDVAGTHHSQFASFLQDITSFSILHGFFGILYSVIE